MVRKQKFTKDRKEEAVRISQELSAKGKTYRQISHSLFQAGYVGRKGNPFTKDTVRQWLKAAGEHAPAAEVKAEPVQAVRLQADTRLDLDQLKASLMTEIAGLAVPASAKLSMISSILSIR